MPRGHVVADGTRVAKLRGEADLTQCQLAELAGYGLRTISKIEAGRPTGAATLSAIATVLGRRLNRRVEVGDLLPRQEASVGTSVPGGLPSGTNALLVAESIKVLDIQHWSAAGESRAILHDHVRFRCLPAEQREVTCHYATTGTRLEGRCRSHPGQYAWRRLTDGHAATEDPSRYKERYALSITLENVAAEGCEIQNEVEFIDGFSGEEIEWFHSPIVFPTEWLTMLLRFPDHKPFRAIKGMSRLHPATPYLLTRDQPIGIPEGKLAYWRIGSPQMGEVYQLEWRW
jgi:transcriptional regulator with XRE-family HTH domain